ncbi:MAG TPA: RNA methyltransferase [candidate division Zixibacteria bacterium]|nr:RNA methyltransferase [candidate division Zixibacteria bacterium]
MITSTSNPLIKRIRKLKQKKYRAQEGAFFVEGVRVFLSAVEAKTPIQKILYSPELLKSDLALASIITQREAGIDCVETTAQVFQSISSREHPVGLGAVVSTNWLPLESLPILQDGVFVCLVEVAEPGNLGSIIRTVDAIGGNGLIVAGQSVDPFHPAAVKASMGTLFHVPISHVDSAQNLLSWTKERGITTVMTSARATQSFWDVDYMRPIMIMMGNEREGLPAELMTQGDYSVSMPMGGSASSLNLAVAAGLIMYEILRRG